jgi:FtsH-binding integral membrane protein
MAINLQKNRPEGEAKTKWFSQRYVEIVALNLCVILAAATIVFVSHQDFPVWVIVAAFVGTCLLYELSWATPTIIVTLLCYTALAIGATFYLKSYKTPMEGLGVIFILAWVSKRQSGGGY